MPLKNQATEDYMGRNHPNIRNCKERTSGGAKPVSQRWPERGTAKRQASRQTARERGNGGIAMNCRNGPLVGRRWRVAALWPDEQP